MFLESKLDQEKYEREFCRMESIKQDKVDVFIGDNDRS